jgi:hypothetical protein
MAMALTKKDKKEVAQMIARTVSVATTNTIEEAALEEDFILNELKRAQSHHTINYLFPNVRVWYRTDSMEIRKVSVGTKA